ncbi:centrosomal protein POC5-like [Diadema antillarum]|uniref:centrosomal protein POC5-like n=1 Tax=Diadema antillarum TaxID=105358 RepID=UPI003A8C2BB3
MSTTTDADSIPMLPPDDSPGSSVSSSLQEEYQELLQYAVVTPHYDPSQLPQTLAGAARSFQPQRTVKDQLLYVDSTATEESASTSDGSDPLGASMRAKQGSVDEEEEDEVTTEEPDGDGVQIPGELHRRDLTELSSPMRLIPDAETPETPTTDQSTIADTSDVASSPVVDGDIVRMEKLLDSWSLELKRNILAELSQAKIAVIERHRMDVRLLKERQQRELRQLQNEIESQKELLHTFEQSVERKDHIISNLTRAVQKEKDRFEMLRRFESWKLRHSEDRRQAFTTKLARLHRERHLKSKVWSAWHSIIVAKWRQRVEKACQSKAQEVCMKLTNDYEARIASLNEALEAARTEVTKLHAERDQYEESMKKAFMRGVCALNMEAMAMFHEGEGNGAGSDAPPPGVGPMPARAPIPAQAPSRPVPSSMSPAMQLTTENGHMPAPRVVTSQHASTPSTVTQTHRSGSVATKRVTSAKTTQPSKTSQSSKTVTARVTGRSDLQPSGSLGGVGLNPPMASVVVERHHPITQQTLGHATAARYPVTTHGTAPPSSMPARGRGAMPPKRQPVSGVPTVKVVH